MPGICQCRLGSGVLGLALGQKEKTGSGAVVGVGFLSAPDGRFVVDGGAGFW